MEHWYQEMQLHPLGGVLTMQSEDLLDSYLVGRQNFVVQYDPWCWVWCLEEVEAGPMDCVCLPLQSFVHWHPVLWRNHQRFVVSSLLVDILDNLTLHHCWKNPRQCSIYCELGSFKTEEKSLTSSSESIWGW